MCHNFKEVKFLLESIIIENKKRIDKISQSIIDRKKPQHRIISATVNCEWVTEQEEFINYICKVAKIIVFH